MDKEINIIDNSTIPVEIKSETMVIYNISGVDYYDSVQFCYFIRKSRVALNNLIRKGNKHRKMKCLRLNTKTFIPCSELTEFPFTDGGLINSVYHFNLKGEKIYEPEYFNS
jgi:hypothetical protein